MKKYILTLLVVSLALPIFAWNNLVVDEELQQNIKQIVNRNVNEQLLI